MSSNFKTKLNPRNLFRSVLVLMMLFFQVSLFAQGRQVTGTITDGAGVTLPGVNVVIKGSTFGTITDFDGKYVISVNKESDVLLYSFVGYLNKEVTVGNQSQINVVLKEDVLQLDEVVAIGYGIQKKSDLTGSVSSVKAESLKSMPVSRVDDALQGKAAGVQVLQNSGQPGAAPVIRVRGLATVNGGNPLVVIDGVSGGSLGDLNPADIESIEILKDAASQGIYGSAGGNGVILVTTKHGNSGKMKVNFDLFAGIQQPWAINVDVCDANQYAEIYNRNVKAGYFPTDGKNYYNHIDTTKQLSSTNWLDEIFRTSFVQNYNLSLSGGNKTATYFLGIGYSDDEGTLMNTFSNKFTVRLNSDFQIAKWLKVGESFNFTNNTTSNQNERNVYNSPISNAIQMLPFVPIYAPANEDGTFNYAYKESGLASNVLNPLAQIASNKNESKSNSMFGNVYAHAEIIKGLSVETRFGMNYNPTIYNQYIPARIIGTTGSEQSATQSSSIVTYNKNTTESSGWQWQNFLTYNFSIDKNNFTIVAGMESGKGKYYFSNKSKNNFEGSEAVNPEKWKEYSDTSNYMTNAEKTISTSGYAYFGRLNYDYNGIILLQANFRRDYNSKFGPNNRAGNFPSISAGLKFSELDFVKNLNIIDFGKIRAGYGATGNSDIQPFLYLNSFAALTSLGYPFDGTNTGTGAALLTAANPDLAWETVVTKNIGLDLGLINNRLNLSVDLFQRSNKEMLLSKSVPMYVGFFVTNAGTELGDANLETRPTVNYGTLNNRGFEVSAVYKDKVGAFNYEINANITRATTVIDDIGDPLKDGDTRGLSDVCRTVNGQPVSAFYGYETDGVYQESEFEWYKSNKGKWANTLVDENGSIVVEGTDASGNAVSYKTLRKDAKPGYFKYKDQLTIDTDGDGKADAKDGTITSADMVNIGDPNPKFTFGLGATIFYKAFDMNFFFQGSYGNKIFNTMKYDSYSSNNGGVNWSSDALNAYIPATYDNSNKNVAPVLVNEAYNTNTGIGRMDGDLNSSSFYVEDGSYLRLKNIQIGYTLPASISSKMKMQRLRVYLGAKNLLTFTKYTGFDPEVGENSILVRGFDTGTYPQSKMFIFGLNVSF